MKKIDELRELFELKQWVGWSSVTKIPIKVSGFAADSTDPETWSNLTDISHAVAKLGLGGIGFVFSADDPYVGIDLDACVKDGKIEEWAVNIITYFSSYTEYSPSGTGIHIIIRADRPGGRLGMRLKGAGLPEKGIEIYYSSRMFAMTGAAVFTGSVPISDRNKELQNLVNSHVEKKAELASPHNSADWEMPIIEDWLSLALDYIPSQDFDIWIKVGLAIKSEIGDSGFLLWDKWSAMASNYCGNSKSWAQWQTFNPRDVSISSVVYLAQQNGFVMPPGSFKKKNEFHDEDGFQKFIGMGEKIDNIAVAKSAGAGLEINWVDYFDVYNDDSPMQPYLIEPRILGCGDMLVFSGPPKSSKSLACLDMFRNFAMGKPWLELLKPSRPLRIAYMQFEVKYDALRERSKIATIDDYSLSLLRGNFKMTQRFTPVLNAHGIEKMAESIRQAFPEGTDENGNKTGADIWVIDPLANIFNGKSENDNADMSQFLREIKYLANLVNPEIAIVIVHHASKLDKKSRAEEPFNATRGASSLRGAYDTGMYIDTDGDYGHRRKLWFEIRNGPGLDPLNIEFKNGRFLKYLKPTKDEKKNEKHMNNLNLKNKILKLIKKEALLGAVFTKTFLTKYLENDHSQRTSKAAILELLIEGKLRFFKPQIGWGLPTITNRSHGFLCVENMQLLVENDGLKAVKNINPTEKMDATSGAIIENTSWYS